MPENNNDNTTPGFETQFVPQSNDEELLYEVEEITAERGNKYRVKWAGVSPVSGKPWPQDWVDKSDCTTSLVAEWKAKKKVKKRGSRTPASTKSGTSTPTPGAPSSSKTRFSAVSEPLSFKDPAPLQSISSTERLQPKKRKHQSRNSESKGGDTTDEEWKLAYSRAGKKQKTTTEVTSSVAATPSYDDRRARARTRTRNVIQTPKTGPSKSGPAQVLHPVVEITSYRAPLTSSNNTTVNSTSNSGDRKLELSPGALARLKIFDRTMSEQSNSASIPHNHDNVNAPFGASSYPSSPVSPVGECVFRSEDGGMREEFQYPEIAVMTRSLSSVSSVHELATTPSQQSRCRNANANMTCNGERPSEPYQLLSSILSLSPIADPPTVIESPSGSINNTTVPEAPTHQKLQQRIRKWPLVVADDGSDCNVEHDELDENTLSQVEEQDMAWCSEKVSPTESEARKRTKKLLHQDQRKQRATGGLVSKPKQLKCLHGDAENNNIAAGLESDVLESDVQQLEDAFVNSEGGKDTTALPPLTSKHNNALRMQLRQEEEERTQDEMHSLLYLDLDPAPCAFDDLLIATGPELSGNSLDKSTVATDNLQRASVIVQLSEGGISAEADNLNEHPASTSSPPQQASIPVAVISDHLAAPSSLLDVEPEMRLFERELAEERGFLHTSVDEEGTHLEAERARWVKDRATWIDEMKLWKEDRDVWEEQRNRWSKSWGTTERSKSTSDIPSEENGANLEEAGNTLRLGEESEPGQQQGILTEERDALLRTVAKLNASIDATSSARASAEKDRDFFREQYMQASSFVNSVREENTVLEERAKVAERQAKEGVVRIKTLFENKVKALHDDLFRWKSLADMLQERDKRTNDEVRSRAAQSTELEDFCKILLEEKKTMKARLWKLEHAHRKVDMQRNKLSRKVASLLRERASLRSKLSKYCTSEESTKELLETLQDSTVDLDSYDMDSGISQRMSLPIDEPSFESDAWFPCLWRPGLKDQCLRIFDSKEDLQRHIQEHTIEYGDTSRPDCP